LHRYVTDFHAQHQPFRLLDFSLAAVRLPAVS
jgi:hypothetical protein